MSLDGLVRASEQPVDRLCTACFTGTYPIALPQEGQIGKHVLEAIERGVQLEIGACNPGPDSELDRLVQGGGAADALDRP